MVACQEAIEQAGWFPKTEEERDRTGVIIGSAIGGFQTNANGAYSFHVAATHPDGIGEKKAMGRALDMAQMNPEDIDYINAHATSTSSAIEENILLLGAFLVPMMDFLFHLQNQPQVIP